MKKFINGVKKIWNSQVFEIILKIVNLYILVKFSIESLHNFLK